MKKEKYEIGERVRIFTLNWKGGVLTGKIGHEGAISGFGGNGGEWYILEPYCMGHQFPAECLELIENNSSYEIY